MTEQARTLWTFAITSIVLVMVTLDNLVVTTALPVIRQDLNASLEGLEWTVNAYTLTFAVLLLTGAALGDRVGRREEGRSLVEDVPLAHARCSSGPPHRAQALSAPLAMVSSSA